MKNYLGLLLALSINLVLCRDFYVGMFKKNDILVAQDRLYKERVPYKVQYAKYGRHFKCAITYYRVVDRLGYGPGPKVVVTRGGLRKKYIVLRVQSMYNQPISVNIYVGCENRMRSTTKPRPRPTKHAREADKNETTGEGGNGNKTEDGSKETTGGGNGATGGGASGSGDSTTGGGTGSGSDTTPESGGGAASGGPSDNPGAASEAAPTGEPPSSNKTL